MPGGSEASEEEAETSRVKQLPSLCNNYERTTLESVSNQGQPSPFWGQTDKVDGRDSFSPVLPPALECRVLQLLITTQL